MPWSVPCFLPVILQVKTLENENSKQAQEVIELQRRLLQEEQQEQQSSKEALELKQKISDLEMGRESAHKEVTLGKKKRVIWEN